MTTIQNLTIPALVEKTTPARVAEAKRRLGMNYAPKRIARLEAYIAAAEKPAKKTASEAKAAPAARQADPVKRIAWAIAAAQCPLVPGKSPWGAENAGFAAAYRAAKADLAAKVAA